MAFDPTVSTFAAIRVSYRCEACGKDLYSESRYDVVSYEIHSATSLHLVNGPDNYLVSDPPPELKYLKGKILRSDSFLIGRIGRPDDAFCLCPTCHRDIYTMAVMETKLTLKDHKGRQAPPGILEMVTLLSIPSLNFKRL